MKYVKVGEGGKPLVVIPGLCVKPVSLTPEVIELSFPKLVAQGYTVYSLDRREDAPLEYSLDSMALDSLYVIEKLGIKKSYLYGHSQGGMIAQLMLLLKPELFLKAVLSSTTSKVSAATEKLFNALIELAERKDTKELYTKFGEKIYSESFLKYVLMQLMEEASKVTDSELERFVYNTRNMLGFDVKDRLSRIKTPSLVITSKADQVFNYNEALELAKAIHAEVLLYESAGHSYQFECKDWEQRMIDFFAEKS